MSTVVDRAVDFVKNYQGLEPKNGKISEESLAKFVQDLEKFLDRENFGKVNGELLPYCGEGYMGEAKIPMWQVADAICKGDKYQYISSTDLGDLINKQKFLDALADKIKDSSQLDRVLWGNGQLEVKEGSGVLNLGDYLSKRIMSEVACGDVKPLVWDLDGNKVFARTEFEALINNKKVTSIWGEDIRVIRELYNNPSKIGLETKAQVVEFYEQYFATKTDAFLKDVHVKLGYDMKGNLVPVDIDATKVGGGVVKLYEESQLDISRGTKVENASEAKTSVDVKRELKQIEDLYEYKFNRKMSDTERSIVKDGYEAYKRYMNNKSTVIYRNPKNVKNVEDAFRTVKKVDNATGVVGRIGVTLWAIDTYNRAMDKSRNGDLKGASEELGGFGFELFCSEKAVLLMEPINVYAVTVLATICPEAAVAGYIILTVAEVLVGMEIGDRINEKMHDVLYDYIDALNQRIDPLIVDLDGDGVETLSLKSGVHFDFNGDKKSEAMGWVGNDDGLLVYDENGNGRIDGGSELFGNASSISEDERAANGFLALANYDSNADGIMDENDFMYSKIQVWKDSNSNGKTEEGELLSLKQAGIQSINLNYTEQYALDNMGNEHNQVSTYTNFDGEKLDIHDVWFEMDSIDTTIEEDDFVMMEETQDIFELPELRGTGKVNTLHQAMLRDQSGELQRLVKQFMDEKDEKIKRQITSELIMRWAGVYAIDPYSRGKHLKDARRLEALEEFLGQEFNHFNTGTTPVGASAERIERAYQLLVETYYYQLKMQTDYKDLFAGITIGYDEEKNKLVLDYSGIGDIISDMSKEKPELAKQRLSDFVDSLYGSGLIESEDMNSFITKVESFDNDYKNILDYASNDVVKGYIKEDTLRGYGGDDLIYGYSGNDTLYGGLGEDTLSGGKGDDTLYGEEGNDILYGNDGNDLLDGGIGDDTLEGGYGNDTYVFQLDSGNKTIIDDAGQSEETIRFGKGITADNIEYSYNGSDLEIRIDAHEDFLTLKNYKNYSSYKTIFFEFSDGTKVNPIDEGLITKNEFGTENDDNFIAQADGKEVNAYAGDDIVHGTEVDDVIHGGNGRDSIYGDKGNDNLFGDDGRDSIRGDAGDDIIYGGDGKDALIGNLGKDTIYGGDSDDEISGYEDDDSLFGENGRDILSGNDGNDIIYGGKGPDTLNGGSGEDFLYGEESDDILYGQKGDDVLDGGSGNDTLIGEEGNDTYIITKGNGNKIINDGIGQNVIRFSEEITKDDLTFSDTNRNVIITIKETGETITLNDVVNSKEGDMLKKFSLEFADGTEIKLDSKSSPIRKFAGSDEGQSMYASAMNTEMYGNAGDDYLYGNDGDDVLFGGLNSDEIKGNSGVDTLYGEEGNDYLYGGLGDDFLYGGSENDQLNGEDGNDTLYGEAGDDTLNGGKGDDILEGGTGTDTLNGDAGNDTYIVIKGNGNIIINDTRDQNIIKFSEGISVDDLEYSDTGKQLIITIKDTGETVTINDAVNSRNGVMLQQFTLQFSDGTEIKLDSENSPFRKFMGNDEDQKLFATEMNTEMHGNAGDDSLYGNLGDDVIYGGLNNDEIRGNAGIDTLFGNSGNDYLCGGTENDVLYGGTGDDELNGEDGNDSLYGESGNDVLNGGRGNDLLDGGTGTDILNGNEGDDTYIITKGCGNKIINDTVGDSVLSFSEGITADDLTFSDTDRNFVITIKETGDTITINDVINSREGCMLNQITLQFDDGTSIRLNNQEGPVKVLRGYDGDDYLYAAAVESTLYGEKGDDIINGNSRKDDLYGGDGNDALFGKEGDDVLFGESGDDKLYGNDGDDTIYSGAGNDALYGGNGNDILTAQEGTNTLNGESGDDTYVIERKTNKVYVSDASGSNVIKFTDGISSDDLSFSKDSNHLYINIKNTNAEIRIDNCICSEKNANYTFYFDEDEELNLSDLLMETIDDYVAPKNGEGVTTIENEEDVILTGTPKDDIITSKKENTFVNGGLGNDTVVGSAYKDVIFGGEGNDCLNSGNGDDVIVCGEGNDNVFAGDGDDAVYGQEGNDAIYGSDGNDIMYGGAGNDKLNGENGDDYLDSGSGNDALSGGNGNDILVAGSGKNSLSGDKGDDTYIISDINGINKIVDGSGENIIKMPESLRKDDLSFETTSGNLIIKAGKKEIITIEKFVSDYEFRKYTLIFANEERIVLNDENGIFREMQGTEESEKIYPIFEHSTIKAKEGNDQVFGTNGSDIIYGEQGDDELVGNAGDDTLYGGEGNDKLRGGLNEDILYGDEGNDFLYGNENDDVLYGAKGNDTLCGGNGNDVLNGGTGINSLSGEAGNDIYEISGNQITTISDNCGENVIKYMDDISVDDLIFERSGDDLIIREEKSNSKIIISRYCLNETFRNYTLVMKNNTEINLAEETEYLKNLYGSDENGAMSAIFAESTLHGNGGDDRINGMDATDTIYGDLGEDYIFGNGGNDKLYGGNDNDQIYGGNGADTVHGNEGKDIIRGEDGDDFLFGDEGDDTIYGGNGNDILDSGTGVDVLNGNSGDDSYIIGKNYNVIRISDTDGVNTLKFEEGISIEDLQCESSTGDFIINVKNGNTKVVLSNFSYQDKYRNYLLEFSNGDTIDILDENGIAKNLKGTDSGETLFVAVPGASVDAKAGNDIIYGSNLSDELYAGKGYDYIDADRGDDFVSGGPGDDILKGNDGNDVMTGEEGDDYLYGGNGDDTLDGGSGNDYLEGHADNDILNGKSGDDIINAGDGDDHITAGSGDDVIYGGNGSDVISPNSGMDYIESGNGNDTFIIDRTDGIATIWDKSGSNVLKFADGIMLDDLIIEDIMDNLIIKIKNTNRIVILKEFNESEGARKISVELSDGTTLKADEFCRIMRDREVIRPYASLAEPYSEKNTEYVNVGVGTSLVPRISNAKDVINSSLNSNMAQLLVEHCSTLASDSGVEPWKGKDCQDNISFTQNIWNRNA